MPSEINTTDLRNYLTDKFNLAELKTLCVDISNRANQLGTTIKEIDPEDVCSDCTKQTFALQLIQYLVRRSSGKINLVNVLVQLVNETDQGKMEPFPLISVSASSASTTPAPGASSDWSDAELDMLLSKTLIAGQLVQLINHHFGAVNDYLPLNAYPAQARSGLIQFCRAQGKVDALLSHIKTLNSGGYDQTAKSLNRL